MDWNETYWKDRVVEYPNRYSLKNTSTLVETQYDATAIGGTNYCEGTRLNADNLQDNINGQIHKNIQHGVAFLEFPANQRMANTHITFDIPFKQNTWPIVFLTDNWNADFLDEYTFNQLSNDHKALVTNANATGFDLTARLNELTGDEEYRDIAWVAIGEMENIHTRLVNVTGYTEVADARTGIVKEYVNIDTYIYNHQSVSVNWEVEIDPTWPQTETGMAAIVFAGDINTSASDGGIVEVKSLTFAH